MFDIGFADTFFLRCFGDVTVARYHGVRGIEHDLPGERFRIVTTDLRQSRVGHRDKNDVAERGCLLDCACTGVGAGILNQFLELVRVARGEHNGMTGFGEQCADGAAKAAGADHADLRRAALRQPAARGYRKSARRSASCEREQRTT